MDQSRRYSGVTAVVQILFDKEATCNNSIGLLSGIPRPDWVTSLPVSCNTTRVSGDQPPVPARCPTIASQYAASEATKENNEPVGKINTTTPNQTNNPSVVAPAATSSSRLPTSSIPLCPPHSPSDDLPGPAPHTHAKSSSEGVVVSRKGLSTRPRSISEVQDEIRSLINVPRLQSVSATTSHTESLPPSSGNAAFDAGSHPQVGVLAEIQAVTPQLMYGPMSHKRGKSATGVAKQPPDSLVMQRRKGDIKQPSSSPSQDVQLDEVRRFRSLLAADCGKPIPNPAFVIQGDWDDAEIYANQCCELHNNPVLGRRLVLFSDGSECPNIPIASAAVAYKRVIDLNTAVKPSWIKESYGIIRPGKGLCETIALTAALQIVRREAEDYFATSRRRPSGSLEPLNVYIFVDSQDSILNLRGVVACSTRKTLEKDIHISQLVKVWNELRSHVLEGKLKLQVRWVKGHKNADGNITADKLAKYTMNAVKKLYSKRPTPSALGQGYEVIPLGDMEHELQAQTHTRRLFEEPKKQDENGNQNSVAQQSGLNEIQKLFTDFFTETRRNIEEQNRLAIDELKREIAKQSLQKEVQNAQVGSIMRAIEEASEWKRVFAAQSHGVKMFQKAGEEMLQKLREETEEAIRTIAEAAISRGAAKGAGRLVEEETATAEAADVMTAAGQTVGMIPPCASSGETVYGETQSQGAGPGVREHGDKSIHKGKGKLRLRVLVPALLHKSVRKLRIPFAASSNPKAS